MDANSFLNPLIYHSNTPLSFKNFTIFNNPFRVNLQQLNLPILCQFATFQKFYIYFQIIYVY